MSHPLVIIYAPIHSNPHVDDVDFIPKWGEGGVNIDSCITQTRFLDFL